MAAARSAVFREASLLVSHALQRPYGKLAHRPSRNRVPAVALLATGATGTMLGVLFERHV